MIFKAIMRYFSYLFHIVLAVVLLALGGIALSTGTGSLRLGMLPWTGDTLNYVLVFGSLAGLATILLAMKGMLRILFLIWSFLIVVLLFKGYIFSRYTFAPNEFRIAAFLIVGSLLALLGAWFQLRTSARPRKY
jgi:hypothetical protein